MIHTLILNQLCGVTGLTNTTSIWQVINKLLQLMLNVIKNCLIQGNSEGNVGRQTLCKPLLQCAYGGRNR